MSIEAAIIENPIAGAGGWFTAGSAVLLQTANALGIEEINPWLTAGLSFGGFIFLILKIKNMRLRNRLLKQKLEKDAEQRENTKGEPDSDLS